MTLSVGARFGNYEILDSIGAGGMGEVYRARDTSLGREVAVKVLPEAFSQDKEHSARFEREARLLASLNHPGIATLHGLEHHDDIQFLVMELVPGDTLAERMTKGPIPLEETLAIARQMAQALEAAHEHAVIHRDLKPANVKVTEDGVVKLLDFGLAKALGSDAGTTDSGLSHSPTMMRPTEVGTILGTAGYMSPEQARGKKVDRRADIWAFGVVVFEMLTNRPLFQGETVSDTLAAVLRADVEWDRLPAETSPLLRRLLARCLTREPKSRLQAIGDARIELEEIAVTPFSETRLEEKIERRGIPAVVVLPVVAALVGATFWATSRTTPMPDPKYLEMELAAGTRLTGGHPDEVRVGGQRPSRKAFAIAPDGSAVVYAAPDGENSRLYLRRFSEPQSTPLAGTEGGSLPFFSPDGEQVGFHTRGGGPQGGGGTALKRVPVGGGQARTIVSEFQIFDVSWAEDDTIFFSGGESFGGDAIYRVPSSGGSPERLTTRDRESGEIAHLFPAWLPDGDALVYTIYKGRRGQASEIVVQPTGDERRVLLPDAMAPRFVSSGYLLFARQGVLMAVGFNAATLELTGEPVMVIEDVMQGLSGANSSISGGAAQFDLSQSGTLIYASGGDYETHQSRLFWVDARGAEEPLPFPPMAILNPRLSPDGSKLAASVGFDESELTVFDAGSGALTRFGISRVRALVWSPKGDRLGISYGEEGAPSNLYVVDATGGSDPERLTTSDSVQTLNDWSADNVLVFVQNRDLWVLELEGGEPRPFVNGPGYEMHAAFSPDSRWVAYATDESGQFEVYVRPYPGPEPMYRVTRNGGSRPIWSRDGGTLFYRSGINNRSKMMAVAVSHSGDSFEVGSARELFDRKYLGSTPRRSFDVAADGRFLMVEDWEHPLEPVTQLHVVLNWVEELKRLVPTQ